MSKYLYIVITAVIVGGLSFYGGTMFAAGKDGQANSMGGNFANMTPEQRQQAFQQMGGRAGGLRANGAAMTNGEILSADDKSITLKLRDGGSKIVFFSTTTIISKMVDAAVADLLVGKTVSVQGTTNSDGSVTAQSIQIRPPMPVTPAAGSTAASIQK